MPDSREERDAMLLSENATFSAAVDATALCAALARGKSARSGVAPKVHLVGVGGSGMSSLAAYLVGGGCQVTGSDISLSEAVEKVRSIPVPVSVGHCSENLPRDTDVVVATAAAPGDNPELLAAHRRQIPVLKYAQMLGLLMEERRGVAIAGTHGKTTTTAMVSFILLRAGLHPSFVIGGNVPQLGGPAGLGGGFGAGEILVAEACEYDRSFWNLHPEVAIITNVDRDHLDYFHDDADLVNAFRGLAGRVRAGGVLVVSADDARAQEAVRPVSVRKVTFGSAPEADWCFRPWQRRRQDGRTRFRPTCGGRDLGEFELRVAGEHNVRNALAAAAACAELGVPVEVIRRALAEYRGAGRRLEPIGSARGVDVMDDYAHHPTEIVATLCGFREDHPTRRLWCVFQPHQYSRTRLLMDGFARAFDLADRVVVPDIFTARDSGADRNAVSSVVLVERLRANGVAAEHVPTYDEVVEYLEEKVSAGDVVLTMGAGPVNGVGRSLLGRLVENQVEVGSYANSV